jgi:hypothetical protein
MLFPEAEEAADNSRPQTLREAGLPVLPEAEAVRRVILQEHQVEREGRRETAGGRVSLEVTILAEAVVGVLPAQLEMEVQIRRD